MVEPFDSNKKDDLVQKKNFNKIEDFIQPGMCSKKGDFENMILFKLMVEPFDGNKKDDLLGITDHFFAKGSDVKNSLSAYFGAIGSGYNAQKILRVKSCGVK